VSYSRSPSPSVEVELIKCVSLLDISQLQEGKDMSLHSIGNQVDYTQRCNWEKQYERSDGYTTNHSSPSLKRNTFTFTTRMDWKYIS